MKTNGCVFIRKWPYDYSSEEMGFFVSNQNGEVRQQTKLFVALFNCEPCLYQKGF